MNTLRKYGQSSLLAIGATAAVAVLGFAPTSIQAGETVSVGDEVTTAAPAASGDDLAKKLANPIAAMISVPFQNNFDFGGGPNGDGFQWKMNVQPVIPFSISEDWNLITRTIVPVISQNDIVGTSSQSGLGDTTLATWFSPKAPTSGGWIWGVGPSFLFPTGTDDLLTANQWGGGVTAIALRQAGKFTYGTLVTQTWSFASDGERETVNLLALQPFLAYLPGGGWTYSLNTESSYNFTGAQWTVPINVMVSKMIKIGKLDTQWQLGARYYAEAPDNGPEWGIRFAITLLFPKK